MAMVESLRAAHLLLHLMSAPEEVRDAHLEPCRCGENTHLYPQSPTWGSGGPYAVWCETCEIWGPVEDSKQAAIESWNREQAP